MGLKFKFLWSNLRGDI